MYCIAQYSTSLNTVNKAIIIKKNIYFTYILQLVYEVNRIYATDRPDRRSDIRHINMRFYIYSPPVNLYATASKWGQKLIIWPEVYLLHDIMNATARLGRCADSTDH